jgi:aspartate kinase
MINFSKLPFNFASKEQKFVSSLMKVFKFGGASIQDADAIRQLIPILTAHQDLPLVIVVSAMGKTTQGLEKVFQQKLNNQPYEQALDEVYTYHETIIKALLGDACPQALQALIDWKNQLLLTLQAGYMSDKLDSYYSSLVACGELLSSQIIHYYLQLQAIPCIWLDARESIKTQQGFRDAPIDWKATRNLVRQNFLPLFRKCNLVLTQGFIGSTQAGDTTTLGKEGSDFTGAILATILGAESLTIWKDVPGIMSADPKIFQEATKFEQLSYEEMAKMAFYGAQIVHPQTVKPLAENNIPLYVKPFANWQATGTLVKNSDLPIKQSIYMLKTDQCLIRLRLKSFTFLEEQHLALIFKRLANLAIKVNMLERSAYTLTLCLNNDLLRLKKLTKTLDKEFTLHKDNPVSLLTVMHQAYGLPKNYLKNKTILLEQQCQELYQVVHITK